MLGNMSEYMYVLKCHGAEHSKYSKLNLAIVLSRSGFSFYRSISIFFLPHKSFRRSVFLSFTCLPFLSFYLSCLSTNHFFFPSLKPCQKKLGQSWTTYCALVCYFRTWTILDNILCTCLLFSNLNNLGQNIVHLFAIHLFSISEFF